MCKYKANKHSIFHTDRGNEFKNKLLDEILKTFDIKRSLSMEGYPYDNAVAEATFKIIKTEFVKYHVFETLEELQYELADYVNWFNNHRLYSSLGYLTPAAFRINILKKVVRITVDNPDTATAVKNDAKAAKKWADKQVAKAKKKLAESSKNKSGNSSSKKDKEAGKSKGASKTYGNGNYPKNPSELAEQGWVDVTDPRDKSGNRTYKNPRTGEKVRYDEGKGKNGGHYYRHNPGSTGPNDRYLDKDGNPVRDGSKPSHLYP